MQLSAPMGAHMKCVYGDEMFLSTILLKHPTPINRALHINLQCSVCASPHQSMVDYTGYFMTYVILSFCRCFSKIPVQK